MLWKGHLIKKWAENILKMTRNLKKHRLLGIQLPQEPMSQRIDWHNYNQKLGRVLNLQNAVERTKICYVSDFFLISKKETSKCRVLSDSIWSQLQNTLKSHDCHRSKNDRKIMEAILWKLRTSAPCSDIPLEFCPRKTACNRFNWWALKGLWENFFSLRGGMIRKLYSRSSACARSSPWRRTRYWKI